MHSSRMRTGRSLTVCCSLLPGGGGGGGVCLVPGVCVCLVPGSLPGPGGFSLAGGVCLVPGGVLPGGGVSAWSQGVSAWSRGSAWSWGVVLLGGGSAWSWGACPETPPVNRITHTCKKHNLGHNFVAAGKKHVSKGERTYGITLSLPQDT